MWQKENARHLSGPHQYLRHFRKLILITISCDEIGTHHGLHESLPNKQSTRLSLDVQNEKRRGRSPGKSVSHKVLQTWGNFKIGFLSVCWQMAAKPLVSQGWGWNTYIRRCQNLAWTCVDMWTDHQPRRENEETSKDHLEVDPTILSNRTLR